MLAVFKRRRKPGNQRVVKLFPRVLLVLVGGGAQTLDRLFERESRKPAQPVVESHLAFHELGVNALFEAREHVVGRDVAESERLEHELEALFAALLRHLAVATPAGNFVHVLLNTGDVLDFVVELVAFSFAVNLENPLEVRPRAFGAVVLAGVVAKQRKLAEPDDNTARLEEHALVELGVNALACRRELADFRRRRGKPFLAAAERRGKPLQPLVDFQAVFANRDEPLKILAPQGLCERVLDRRSVTLDEPRFGRILFAGGNHLARGESGFGESGKLFCERGFQAVFAVFQRDKAVRDGQQPYVFAAREQLFNDFGVRQKRGETAQPL